MEVLTRVVLICKNKDRKCCSKRDTQARKTKCTTSKVKCNRLMTLGNIWNTFRTTYNKYTSKANSGAKSTSQDTDKILRQVSDSNTSSTVKIVTDIIQKLAGTNEKELEKVTKEEIIDLLIGGKGALGSCKALIQSNKQNIEGSIIIWEFPFR